MLSLTLPENHTQWLLALLHQLARPNRSRLYAAQTRSGQSLGIGLDGGGGIDQLRLIADNNLDLGQLNGFGLWRMPGGISHPLAMHTSAKVGQTLVANTNAINDVDGLGEFSFQWQQRAKGSNDWLDISGQEQAKLTLENNLVGAELRVIVRFTDGGGTEEVLISQATQVIAGANRAPNVSQPTLLAASMEDGTVLISAVDLLANGTDADGDLSPSAISSSPTGVVCSMNEWLPGNSAPQGLVW